MQPDEQKEKSVEIIINGRPYDVSEKEISFDEIVRLAFSDTLPSGDNLFTVSYRKGGNENRPEGVLVAGDSIKVKKGTVFNVTATSRS